jgi:NAD(P)-dependent dehydrogenase (short-subunit alcohol dehydrogenase family)
VLADQNCFTPEDARLESVKRGIEAEGAAALALPLDVCDGSSVNASFAAIIKRFGEIDILVNAAGSSARKLLADHPDAIWQRMLDDFLDAEDRRTILYAMIETPRARGVRGNREASNGRWPLHRPERPLHDARPWTPQRE